MDRLIRLLFSSKKLRSAIFAEVDFYNSIKRILKDPEDSKVVTAIWCEADGWRGWTIRDRYIFNDYPEKSIDDLFDILEP